MAEALEAMAARARQEPYFLASVLEAFARGEGLDDAGLAGALGCRGEDLLLLRLCRAPRGDGPGFRADVDSICRRFGVEPGLLRHAVKRGRVWARRAAGGQGGFLMAARDREEGPTP
jgi:hypothetical protein